MIRSLKKTILLSAIVGLTAPVVDAQSISLNFGTNSSGGNPSNSTQAVLSPTMTAGVVPLANFNNIPFITGGNISGLVDSQGNASSAAVQIVAGSSYGNSQQENVNNGDQVLNDAGIYGGGGSGTPVSATLSGLSGSTATNIYVYFGQGAGNIPTTITFTPLGGSAVTVYGKTPSSFYTTGYEDGHTTSGFNYTRATSTSSGSPTLSSDYAEFPLAAGITGFTVSEQNTTGGANSASMNGLQIVPVVVAPNQLTWTGAAGSTWDTNVVDNFATADGTPTAFTNGASSVTFTDFLPGTTTQVSNSSIVIQSAGVQPSAVIVNSGTVNYTFTNASGNIGIAGTTGFNQSGASITTLAGSNTYTGPTQISSGQLVLASNGALGSTSGVFVTGGNLTVQPGIALPASIPLTLGTGNDTTSALTLNQSTGSLTFTNPISLTADAVIGTSASTLTLPTAISGAGGLGINSPGLVTLSGSNVYAGQTLVISGSVALTGSINGGNAANSGYLTISPGAQTVGQTAVAGRLEIDGGTANFTSASKSNIAAGFYGAAGSLVLNSGTLNITGQLGIGPGYESYGEFLANGGTANIGGTVFVGTPYGSGVFTVSTGSSVTASANIVPGVAVSGAYVQQNSVVNLNGGTLTTTSVQGITYGGTNEGHIAFNGGTLKAMNNSGAFVSNLSTALIFSGGATVDDGGFAVTIPQALTAAGASGITSVPITTPGTGYSYAPIAEFVGGSIIGGGVIATGVANFTNGQVTGVTITNPGNYVSTTGLTAVFVGGGGTPPAVGTIGSAPNVSGGFTKLGTGVTTLTGSNTYAGTTKISAGTLRVGAVGASVGVANNSFDANSANGFTYYSPRSTSGSGTDGSWNYTSSGNADDGAGITNGSGFQFFNNEPAPNGGQVAFIQGLGTINQTINFPTTGTYTLSFFTEQRFNGNSATQTLDVNVDSPSSGGLDLTPGGFIPDQVWEQETLVFLETAGNHVLNFLGVNPAGTDNTAFLDNVQLNAAYTGGAVTAGIPSASPVVISAGATLDINSSIQTIGSLTGPAMSAVLLGSGVLTLGGDGTSSSFAGVISGTGSVVKTGVGNQTLTGVNTYSGGTNVSGGIVTFASPGAFPTFSSLTIGATGQATASFHNSSSPKNTLFVSTLSLAGSSTAWTGKLDLNNNDLVVRGGSLGTVFNQIAQGYSGGTWQGSGGIVSSSAATDSTHLTALGVIQNSLDQTPTGTAIYTNFDGQTVGNSDVLVKYTYYGDANLSGIVDGSDYTRIDNGYINHLTGWYNGDFNYDGIVNGSDYTLIDNAFNTQGSQLSAELAQPTAEAALLLSGAGSTAAVPEPVTLGTLMLMTTTGLLVRRRRRM